MPIEGKTIVITGGGSGIGAETARVLARRGARPVLLDLNLEHAQAVADEVSGRALQVDVTDEGAVNEVYAQIGAIDGLVNCAGYNNAFAPIVATSLADWRTMTAIDLDGAFLNVKAAAIAMLTNNATGAIVNIASLNASFAHRGLAGYAASKAGVSMLTRVAALEFAAAGIRVNAIAPGLVETPMIAATISDPAVSKKLSDGVPLGRLGQARDIARTAAFLLDDDSGWITGQTIIADGGVSLRVEPAVTPNEIWTADALRAAIRVATTV
jgi:NAD(P)-dependent dehydrogenase (short-subunit alcohol dehydrogenase family)